MNKVLFALVFLISFGFAVSAPPPPIPTILPTHFLLVLQWPYAYCKTITSGACSKPNMLPNEFKIHGLWPEVTPSVQPGESEPALKPSCTQPFFKTTELPSLNDLKQYWPNITGLNRETSTGYNVPFWQHEWDTHGRCQPRLTQKEYFPFVLEIFKDTRSITEEIVNKYSDGTGTGTATGLVLTREIKNYIQTKHQLRVDFKCKQATDHSRERIPYLQEIYFNVSLAGELQDMVTNYNSCSATTRVKFITSKVKP